MHTATRLNQEYIEDRSITEASDDSFRHADVVDELAELALHGPAPSNIALFAPWGTGKSGIAKLLRPQIKQAGQRFVYFDAFKHRDTPLRRSFLRAAVSELDKGSLKKIDTKLYGERVTQTLNRSDKWKLFWIIVGGVATALLFAASVSLGLSKIHPGPFDEDFPGLFAKTSGILALVGGLLGVALTALVNGYSVTKTSTPIAEDDEFEREFKDLVAGSKRVVVFVDELDRCSADDVVEALETMRVFLETANCVFVVAIDQQSLEQALRRKARQETPIDDTHPYFSSTGSYIDKIFQYQIALPPLRSRDMNTYVGDLVGERPGLWADLKKRDELQDVIGALAPTHVTSPRRIKVLLNAFVMAYHLAAMRIKGDQMAPLDERSAALAKLVCLRTEFPLFAEELDRYPELPTVMLALERGEVDDELRRSAPKTLERASAFRDGELPIAPLLFRANAVQSGEGEESDAKERERVVGSIAKQHLANLLGYLGRVDPLAPITPDLIYLHSAAGSGTDLEPLTADEVEAAARDGSVERVNKLVEEQPEAVDEIVGLLTSILASTPTGSLDATNATRVLLDAIDSSPKLGRAGAENAADEIVKHYAKRELEDRDFAAAIGLSVRCGTRRGAALIALVSSSVDLLYTPPARTRLIHTFPEQVDQGRALALQSAIFAIKAKNDEGLDAIVALDSADQASLFAGARSALSEIFEADVVAARRKAAEESAEGEAEPAADHKVLVAAAIQESLEAALDRFSREAPAACVHLAAAILALNRRPLSDAVVSRLGALSPISDPELRRLALHKANGRSLAERGRWLIPLDASELDRGTARLLDEVAAKTWSDLVDQGEDKGETFENLVSDLRRLAEGAETIETRPLDEAIDASLEIDAVDNPESEALTLAASLVSEFVSLRLADPERAQSALAHAFARALSVLPPGQPEGRPNLVNAFELIRPQLQNAGEMALSALFERALAAPIETVGLLRTDVMVAVANIQKQRGLDADDDQVQTSLLDQIAADPSSSASIATRWVSGGRLSARRVWDVIAPYWAAEIPDGLRAASMKVAAEFEEDELKTVVGLAFDRVLAGTAPPPANWEAIGLRSLSSSWVIDDLVSRVEGGNITPEGWRGVLEICKQLSVGVAAVQARIGEELLLPLAQTGDDGFRLAVDHLSLVGKGKAGQGVIEELTAHAGTDERRRLLARQLHEDQSLISSLTKGVRGILFPRKPSPEPDRDDKNQVSPADSTQGEQQEQDPDDS